VARRREPPVPGLHARHEPRALRTPAAPSPDRAVRGGSFFAWRLRGAAWVAAALAVFAVVLAVVWRRPEPLGGTAAWALAALACAACARLVDPGPVRGTRALALLGLVVAALVLLLVGAASVARGERA